MFEEIPLGVGLGFIVGLLALASSARSAWLLMVLGLAVGLILEGFLRALTE